ncbi:DNA repair protein complementing XP-C cells isoform X1 [Ornithorhynchus anatinus]|uniref:XPC complex subunit, DNA damage recognition and repair factor n=2 Tax=Ornithorhynchus anatinus TaxID=9258 RepID=F7E3S8_ORNAN|nr:DNA repair protein complementing XP-C cells isoform X1 [Ornithorhynchus anatinus]
MARKRLGPGEPARELPAKRRKGDRPATRSCSTWRRGQQWEAAEDEKSQIPAENTHPSKVLLRKRKRRCKGPGDPAGDMAEKQGKAKAKLKHLKDEKDKDDDEWAGFSGRPSAFRREEPREPALKIASSDEDEWEDVEELTDCMPYEKKGSSSSFEPFWSSKPVEIEIETPEQAKLRERREKEQIEFQTYLRRTIKRFHKEVTEDMHKVHLLCLLADGLYRNTVCNMADLQAISFSIIPEEFTTVPPRNVNVFYLSNLVKWFTATFTINPNLPTEGQRSMEYTLSGRFAIYSARDEEELIHMFLLILRSLQFFTRLVLSLQPIPLKLHLAKSKKTSKFNFLEGPGVYTGKPELADRGEHGTSYFRSLWDDKGPEHSRDPLFMDRSQLDREDWEQPTSSKKCRAEEMQEAQRTRSATRDRMTPQVRYKEESDSDTDLRLISGDALPNVDYKLATWCPKPKKKPQNSARKLMATGPLEIKQPTIEAKTPSSSGTRRRKITFTDEEEEMRRATGTDQWLEVFCSEDDKWVSLDCVHGVVGEPEICFKYASKPVSYILGIDNDGCVQDVTKRYDPAWMTTTCKNRIDSAWLAKTLTPYETPFRARREKEELEFQTKLQDQPLPTAVGEYKNHPLYVLKRHLLKYEAIYPETPHILGYCRGEAVYSRSCVHTLHSKDTWLKQARVVRCGEVPYKMVKGYSNRARKARLADPHGQDQDDLALFGFWQTEPYQPPVAMDGKVPRNAYGNVYLFQPCMLPIGCVHLKLPNLHRVAHILGIDCVQAITGFEFYGGYSHPITDGYIVCEEHKEILIAAWVNEQEIIKQKESEKREKKILNKWVMLMKGLLIRERLKVRYGIKKGLVPPPAKAEGFSSGEEGTSSKAEVKDLAVSGAQNRQAKEVSEEEEMKKTNGKEGKEGADP